MTADSGIYFLVRKILSAKTATEAREYIEQHVGDEYLSIARELVSRVIYKRTITQNSTIHGYFGQIAQQTGEDSLDVKNRAKYQIGLPILLRDDPENEAKYKRVLAHLDFEDRCKAMEVVAVTSLMTTKQLKEFQDTFARRMISEGYELKVPEDK